MLSRRRRSFTRLASKICRLGGVNKNLIPVAPLDVFPRATIRNRSNYKQPQLCISRYVQNANVHFLLFIMCILILDDCRDSCFRISYGADTGSVSSFGLVEICKSSTCSEFTCSAVFFSLAPSIPARSSRWMYPNLASLLIWSTWKLVRCDTDTTRCNRNGQ